MDKTRIIKLNSQTRPVDSQVTVGDYVLTYNRSDNLIILEKFNFKEFTRVVIVNTQNASELFPKIWEETSGFDMMDIVKEKTEDYKGEEISLREIP